MARVDLKADRRRGRLVVQSAHAEDDLVERGTTTGELVERLAGELGLLATWLDLDDVEVRERGGLAAPLARSLR